MYFSSGCCVNLKVTLGHEPIDSIDPDLLAKFPETPYNVQYNWAEILAEAPYFYPFNGTETLSGMTWQAGIDMVFEFEIVHENGLDYGAHMMVNGKPVYRLTTYYDPI